MENPVSDYMKNWLNTTYDYLKKTGGPTYPAKTVGPDVLPTGPYSLVEDYQISYDQVPIDYGQVPLPFNPGATGIPATANSQVDAVTEVAKQNPPPTVFSKNFGILYGNNMSACIADQEHRACNPNTINACRDLAEQGDSSGMVLMQNQKDALGIIPPSQENNKPDDIRLAENEGSLTAQISRGAGKIGGTWSGFAAGLGQGLVANPSGNKTLAGNPSGVNFQSLNDRLKGFIPGIPDIPGVNTGSVVMIGGAIVLVVLLIAIIK
jgi:hypothetical protein